MLESRRDRGCGVVGGSKISGYRGYLGRGESVGSVRETLGSTGSSTVDRWSTDESSTPSPTVDLRNRWSATSDLRSVVKSPPQVPRPDPCLKESEERFRVLSVREPFGSSGDLRSCDEHPDLRR